MYSCHTSQIHVLYGCAFKSELRVVMALKRNWSLVVCVLVDL